MTTNQNLCVKDIMSLPTKAVRVDETLDLSDPFAEWWKIRHLPVIDEAGKLTGLISHRDLLNQALLEILKPPSERKHFVSNSIKVKDFMLWKVLSTRENTPVQDAARLMYENKMGCLPVVDANEILIGIVSEADFVRLQYQ